MKLHVPPPAPRRGLESVSVSRQTQGNQRRSSKFAKRACASLRFHQSFGFNLRDTTDEFTRKMKIDLVVKEKYIRGEANGKRLASTGSRPPVSNRRRSTSGSTAPRSTRTQ